jgi:hypothetical protein
MHIAIHPIPALPPLTTDGQVQGLTAAEMLALATLRMWAAPHRRPNQRHPDWRQGPQAAGLEDDAADAFDVLMRLVVRAAHRQLDVRCPQCPGLGADEVAFIEMLRAAQAHPRAADPGLAAWLPPPAVRAARPFLAQFAAAMAARDLWLPERLAQGSAGSAMTTTPHGRCLH